MLFRVRPINYCSLNLPRGKGLYIRNRWVFLYGIPVGIMETSEIYEVDETENYYNCAVFMYKLAH